MTVSLFISLVLRFKSIIFIAATILLTVKNWTSSIDKPLNMGDAEDKLSLVLCTTTLPTAALKLF
jgi:hypothetical protein